MSKTCKTMWAGLVDLAEGKDSPDAAVHVDSCDLCRTTLQGLRRTLSSLAVPQFEAPLELINRAKAIMSPSPSRMRLLRTSLSTAGARAVTEEFQAIYGFDELELRVMYAKVDTGWNVIGRLPSVDWTAAANGEALSIEDDGHFSFTVKSLEDSSFEIAKHMMRLEVPSASEATRGHQLDS